MALVAARKEGKAMTNGLKGRAREEFAGSVPLSIRTRISFCGTEAERGGAGHPHFLRQLVAKRDNTIFRDINMLATRNPKSNGSHAVGS